MAVLNTLHGISAEFTPDEIECLIRTAAELWAQHGDPNDDLSARQRDLAERARELAAHSDEPLASTPIPFRLTEEVPAGARRGRTVG